MLLAGVPIHEGHSVLLAITLRLRLVVFACSLGVLFAPDAVAQQLPGSGIIPSSRLARWEPGQTVGVPGGIPTNRTQCMTAECQAVTNAASSYKDGSTDAQTLINAATASCVAGTYVLLPAGTWRITSPIVLGQADDNCTLRGERQTTTVIDCRISFGGCITVGTGFAFNYPVTGNSVTGYAASGNNTVLTMASTAEIGGAGALVKFTVANDLTIPVMSTSGYDHLRQQVTRVVSKTPTTVTVFPGIYGYERFAGLKAYLYSEPWTNRGVGIEDLTIDANRGGAGNVYAGIVMQQAADAWVKNVKVIRALNYTISIVDSLNVEVRHSTFGQLAGSGSNGAGMLVNSVSGSLFEDNIVTEAFPSIEVNHGSSGNVFAYNFIHNKNGAIGIDTNHGPHNSFNLYEGNVAHNLMSDGYFGSNSDDTIYRNLLHGNGIADADGATLTYCLSLKRFTRNFSVVGNIIGSSKHSGRCESYGQPNIGNGGSTGTAQPSLGDWWGDFKPSGTAIVGQLTARTSNTLGVVTLSSGNLAVYQTPVMHSNSAPLSGTTILATVQVKAVTGNQVTVDSSFVGHTLPPLNTVVKIMPGAAGFQELDLDVEATTLKKANNWVPTGIPASESLAGQTLPSSLYLNSKPGWFGQLAWPPFDPLSPNPRYEAIPAGYRFLHGTDPAGVGQLKAPSGLKVTPQ